MTQRMLADSLSACILLKLACVTFVKGLQ